MQITLSATLTYIKKPILKFLWVAILFALVSTVSAQGDKSASIVYKVTEGETFASIAAKYNISPQALAEYNNLDYYEGALISKSLRIPTKKVEAEPKKEVAKKIEVITDEPTPPTKTEVVPKPVQSTPPVTQPSTPNTVSAPEKTRVETPPAASPATTENTVSAPQNNDTKTEPAAPSAEEEKQKATSKTSGRLPPLKEMLPFIIFLSSSIILLFVAIFFYKSLQR